MYLLDDKKNEKIFMNENLIITSNSRIYIKENLKCDKQVLFEVLDKKFPNSSKNYEEKIYIYERLGNNLDGLEEVIQETNMFMLYLIENNAYDFFKALREYKTHISQEETYSLFKPVFQRYKHLKKDYTNLEKIRRDILNSKYSNYRKIKKVTLYNVPCRIENSYLKIINNFWIDLREVEYIKEYGYQTFDCISLGEIKEFDRVEIELIPIYNPELENFSLGFDIKRVTFEVKYLWR